MDEGRKMAVRRGLWYISLWQNISKLSFTPQLALCLFLTSSVYKPWVRGEFTLKAPFWSPWTDNDCTASLLLTKQALHAVVPASPKQSLHNRACLLDFNGPVPPLLAPNCRKSDPTHDWQRNSITGRAPRSALFQFYDAQTGIAQVANHCACRVIVP